MSPARLVLVGGGHTHLHVLRSLALNPEPALRPTLISTSAHATYTGMVPGVLAGQYAIHEAQIDLHALTAAAQVSLVEDRVVRIDAARRVVELKNGPAISYDLLSLDIGSRPAAAERVAAGTPVVMVKPIEGAVAQLDTALHRNTPGAVRQAVVAGAGAGGVEIAFALAARLRGVEGASVTIVDRDAVPVPERGKRTSDLVQRAFARRSIAFVGGVEVTGADASGVHFRDGRTLAASLIVWATGAVGPTLLADSGLPVDERGFLRVGDDLRVAAYPEIFAAGDCASLKTYPALPKAGVYAVRQGPVLAHNLRAAADGRNVRLNVFVPRRRFLSLLNTCDGRAIASYGPLALEGRWAWRLKDRIDRSFIRKHARPTVTANVS